MALGCFGANFAIGALRLKFLLGRSGHAARWATLLRTLTPTPLIT